MKNPSICYLFLFLCMLGNASHMVCKEEINVESLLDSCEYFASNNSIIGNNEWEELELDAIIADWKKYYKTKFDVWGVKRLLKYAPSGSQGIIRTLIENEGAFDLLDEIIDTIKNNEDSILSYWQEGDKFQYDAERLYFSFLKKWFPRANKFLNSNETLLETSQFLEFLKPCTSLLALLGVDGAINGFVFSKIFKVPFSLKESILTGLKKPIRDHTLTPAVFKTGDFNYQDANKMYQFVSYATLGDRYIATKSLFKKATKGLSEKTANIVSGGLSAILQGALTVYYDYWLVSKCKHSIDRLLFLYKTAQKLQTQLSNIAEMIRVFEKISELEKISDSFIACDAIQNIKLFLHKKNLSSKLEKLTSMLEKATFDKTNSWVFFRGRMLRAHKLLIEIKDELIPFLQNVSILGGYMALVRMFKDHQDSHAKFCFVQFVNQETPYVQLKNAWAPLLKKEEVVVNDIALGVTNGPRNAIFTGPNGGGKTTSMLMVALNVLLSHLGIAAAQEAYISSIDKIRTSLRPKSDIKSGMSTFMSEQKRMQDVLNDINACDGTILVLLDEPYSGTVEAESAHRVYKFGEDLATCKNCMLLIATHLEKPIYLENDTNAFVNLQMGYIQKKADQSFKRTFKLEYGPALWWFHNAQMRSSFVDWLCDQEIGNKNNIDAL